MKRQNLALVSLISLVLTLACGDDDPTAPVPAQPSLENIWPNEDQQYWLYTLEQLSIGFLDPCADPGTCFDTPEEVPDAPSLGVLETLVGNQDPPQGAVRETGGFKLHFDGMRTTETGLTGQNLVETLLDVVPSKSGEQVLPNSAVRFLAMLALARPDLAPAIDAAAPGVVNRTDLSLDSPLFLHGLAWEKTLDHIGTLSDVDTMLGWKYLEADLTVGHEFTFQLVRPLADDVFLHARIVDKGTRSVPDGIFRNCIEVLYLVDYGITVPDVGPVERYHRVISYGLVTYAPNVGPIACKERHLVTVRDDGSLGVGVADAILELVDTGVPEPMPVALMLDVLLPQR